MPGLSNNVGTYVRRRELTCTLEELETHGSAVLLPGEVLYVDQGNGIFDIKIGDGVTSAADLPYVIRVSEMRSIQEAAESASRLVSNATKQIEDNAEKASQAATQAAASNEAAQQAKKASEDARAGAQSAKTASETSARNAKSSEGAAKKSADDAAAAKTAAENIVKSVDPDEDGTVANSLKLGGIEASGYARNHYAYNGRDLSKVFASAAVLHTAVAAGDFSKINIGDYWPITLSGTVHDYADAADKTLSNAVFNMEVAGIDLYKNYGDTPVTAHHLLMCSRDLLPWVVKMRNPETTWYDTTKTNPWLGSALYATLNNASNGVLPRLLASPLGPYIFAGPNGAGMRFLGEIKAAAKTAATGWEWLDRGRLFLPSEREVWGGDTWSEYTWGAGLAMRWPIFEGSLRHVVKGLGNGGSRYNWWCLSSSAGSAAAFTAVTNYGYPYSYSAANSWMGAPLCFLFT